MSHTVRLAVNQCLQQCQAYYWQSCSEHAHDIKLPATQCLGGRASKDFVVTPLFLFCACWQSRYSKSVESVVSALVDDTVSLNKCVGGMEGLVSRQQGQLQDTKEALLR